MPIRVNGQLVPTTAEKIDKFCADGGRFGIYHGIADHRQAVVWAHFDGASDIKSYCRCQCVECVVIDNRRGEYERMVENVAFAAIKAIESVYPFPFLEEEE